jgi:hypothetical protein
MKKIIVLIWLAVLLGSVSTDAKIAILANRYLSANCKNAIRNFAEDIELIQGRTVWLDMTNYDHTTPAVDILNRLKTLYSDPNDPIEGAIFVGEMPYVFWEELRWSDSRNAYLSESFVCDRFFMDLNGQYMDNQKDDASGMKTGYYDAYSGDNLAEIWVSRISFGAVKNAGDEEPLMLDYLARVRNRMAGGPESVSRRALLVQNNSLYNPSFTAGTSYGSNYLTLSTSRNEVTTENYYNNLRNGYEYSVILDHGISNIAGPANSESYVQLSSSGAPSNCRFFYILSCAAGAFDIAMLNPYNDCIAALMGLTQNGLVCVAHTMSYSFFDLNLYNAFNSYIARDSSVGQAVRLSGNQYNQSAVTRTIIFGAANLRFTPYPAVKCLVKQAEIGKPANKGSFNFQTGSNTFQVVGGGLGIGGTSDQCKYVYHSFNGDGTMSVTIPSVPNLNANARAGIMLRDDITPNCKQLSLLMSPTKGVCVVQRTAAGASATSTSYDGTGTFPKSLKLVRVGNTVTLSSGNGSRWVQLGTYQVTISPNACLGLAVTAGTSSVQNLCSVGFTSVLFPATQVAMKAGISLPYQAVMSGNKDFQIADASSICSGPITDMQESRFRFVADMNSLYFKWKVDSEQSYDYLSMNIDGALMNNICGNQGWVTIVSFFSTPMLSHRVASVEWIYSKDVNVSVGQDKGWISAIQKY